MADLTPDTSFSALHGLQHKIKGTVLRISIFWLEAGFIYIPEIAHSCYSYLTFVFILIKKGQTLLLYYSPV